MFSLLLLLQAASGDIVITGKKLEEAQAMCVKGGCTPLRDAQATIALAESQFRDGRYLDSKRLLAAAIGRNRAKATTDPKPVAALYEAYATVTLHEGDLREYRDAVGRQVRTLRDNLPPDDTSVVAATTAIGDMWLKLGDTLQADKAYRSIEEDALQAGNERPAMLAGMKRAWLAAAQDRRGEALRKLDELGERQFAQQPAYRTALRVMRLRIAAKDADEAELATLVSAVSQSQSDDPTLIWAPKYDLDTAGAVTQSRAVARRLGDFTTGQTQVSDLSAEFDTVQWVDVGFWIRPDGRTAGAEVLRGSAAHPWSAIVTNQIAVRRYTASDAANTSDGVYKVERFTRRSEYMVPKGSLIRRRVATGSFEVLDLTDGSTRPNVTGG